MITAFLQEIIIGIVLLNLIPFLLICVISYRVDRVVQELKKLNKTIEENRCKSIS